MKERWRTIAEFPVYEISDLGNVRRGNKRLTVFMGSSGYLCVTLCMNGKFVQRLVHRLVLLAFDGEPLLGQQACHGEAGRQVNALSNLRWGTSKENALDRLRDGKGLLGEQSARGKLSWEEVKEVRRVYTPWSKEFGMTALARKFGVNKTSIHRALIGQTWWAKDYGLG